MRCHTDISLYLPITWLLRICSHWPHWKAKSSLWALAVSTGQVYHKMYLVSHWHFIISPYSLRCHTDISLYLPITWLFRICSHWLHWKVKSSLWALAVSNWGVYCKMYLVSHWHVLISSYYLTVSNLLSLTTLKSEEFTLSSGSFKWGGVYGKMYLVSHWHVLISSYYLTVLNGVSLTALKSEEFTLSSGSFKWGGYCQMYLVSHWHFLISSYYLTVLNGLSLTALKSEEFTLSSGSFEWGGS